MHELSIAISIIDGVLEEAEAKGHGGAQVEAVHLRLGRLSGVDRDALLFSYRVACESTPLSHSRLMIEDVDLVILCPKCGAERSTQAFPVLLCAVCGSPAERILRGTELEISGFEVAA